MNAATLIVGSESRICLQTALSSRFFSVERFSDSKFRPIFWEARPELRGPSLTLSFLVPALHAKSYAPRLRPLPTGEAFMSLNPCCASNKIVNRHWNRFSLTRWNSQYFFGREMVGPQFRFREHIPIVS